MSRPTFELKGKTELLQKLGRLAKQAPKEMEAAVYREALVEMRTSMSRTPVDTGALRASHLTREPVRSGSDISCTVECGGVAGSKQESVVVKLAKSGKIVSPEGYAIRVHEDLEAHHTTGQAKFLESTFMDSRSTMAERLAKRIQIERWDV